jgi:hypothetical protein
LADDAEMQCAGRPWDLLNGSKEVVPSGSETTPRKTPPDGTERGLAHVPLL